MNKKIDMKLALIRAKKLQDKESDMLQKTQDLVEKNTGIIMKTRLLNEEGISI